MKQFVMIAALAVASFSANAQMHRFHNDSQCDVEYREVCIDVSGAPGGCTITGVGPWVTVPAATHVNMPNPPGCAPPDEVAIEVRYAASTGCSGSVIMKFDPGPFSTTPCFAFPSMGTLPPCSPCAPNGLNLHVNVENLHIDML